MLIRGGSNYAYEQVKAELADFIAHFFGLDPTGDFSVAVCGLRVKSEHEDECCVMVELLTDSAKALETKILSDFIGAAKKAVTKGAKVLYCFYHYLWSADDSF